MLTGRPPTLRSFDYKGLHRYSLTFCTDRRKPIFREHAPVALVLTQVSRASLELKFAVITYCFMPDHLHLLVRGECESSECRNFISLAKQYSGYYYKKQFKESLWQRYGYERTLRNEESTLKVARYILENPLRARLVANVVDYPFVGSLAYDFKDLLEATGRDRRATDDQIEL